MAGAINLTEIDFNQIKDNLIDYLKSTKQFTDYDFDGSNLQVILNLIAYQAQLNAYNTNMIANESFLSSASIRSNVVTNARMIGYSPSSAISATSSITADFQLEASQYPSGYPKFVQMTPGLAFMAQGTGGSVQFNVVDTQTVAVDSQGLARFDKIGIYEGTYLTAEFTVDESIYNQKFIIRNEYIDTSTLRVVVQEDPNQDEEAQYVPAQSLVTTEPDGRIYWTEEVENGYTELIFGDGLFGKKLENGAVIRLKYVISGGEVGNGVRGTSNYNFTGRIIDSYGGAVTVRPTVTYAETSNGGASRETISSIKFRAPRTFATQNRCVVADDYAAMVRRFYPAIDDIYVYGGEELEIPQYGRVFIVVKPTNAEALSAYAKSYIKSSLDKFRIGSLDVQIVDPEVVYVEAVTKVFYDLKATDKDASAITAAVKSALTDYSNAPNITKFGSAVKFSQVVSIIDDADGAITRNNTELRMRRDVVILPDTPASYETCFDNSFDISNSESVSTIYSTGFQMLNSEGVNDGRTYYFEDDTKGNLRLFYFNDENVKVVTETNFGTVDYTRGEIMFGYVTPVTFVNTSVGSDIVEVRADPGTQDVLSKRSVSINFDVAKCDIVSVVDLNTSAS